MHMHKSVALLALALGTGSLAVPVSPRVFDDGSNHDLSSYSLPNSRGVTSSLQKPLMKREAVEDQEWGDIESSQQPEDHDVSYEDPLDSTLYRRDLGIQPEDDYEQFDDDEETAPLYKRDLGAEPEEDYDEEYDEDSETAPLYRRDLGAEPEEQYSEEYDEEPEDAQLYRRDLAFDPEEYEQGDDEQSEDAHLFRRDLAWDPEEYEEGDYEQSDDAHLFRRDLAWDPEEYEEGDDEYEQQSVAAPLYQRNIGVDSVDDFDLQFDGDDEAAPLNRRSLDSIPEEEEGEYEEYENEPVNNSYGQVDEAY